MRAAKPAAKDEDHERHVLVCAASDRKSAGQKRPEEDLQGRAPLGGTPRRGPHIDTIACLGPYKHGLNVVVYPEGTWYLRLLEDDVPEVAEQHLKNGEPTMRRLRADRRPRKAKKAKKG